jgi:hypothetical protein
LAFNSKMRSKCFAMICVVLALFFQVSAAASASSMAHGCCGGLMATADAITVAHCCADQSVDRHAGTPAADCADHDPGVKSTLGEDSLSCSSCTGDCAGAGSPIVDSEATAVTGVAAPFVPLRQQVALKLPQASFRLERPPRDTLF